VRAQTLPHWEAIVIDDGHPGGGIGRLVRTFADPRFRVITHPQNLGLGAARNRGVREARAEFVVALDADDSLDASFLEVTIDALESHPEADWVWTDSQLLGDDHGTWRFPVPLPLPCPAHLDYRGAGFLMRRSVWESVGGYVEDRFLSGLEDLDFWLGALERNMKPIHVARPLYRYRVHPGSMTATTPIDDSHLKREMILRRRQRAFELRDRGCARCGRRGPSVQFKAEGYLNSSVASHRRGDRKAAAGYAARGWWLRPNAAVTLALSKQLARSILPVWALRLARSRDRP
jgi:glycosyltransferase involved in cell wall biosynthesis